VTDPLEGAWDRIDCRMVLVGWPDPAPSNLSEAIVSLTTFELANTAPTILDGPAGAMLVWRGYLTGGISTLYHGLLGHIDEHGMTTLLSDQRLEIHVSAGEDRVTVFGALRDAVQLERAEFETKLSAATGSEQLVQSLTHDRLNEAYAEHQERAEEVIERARERDEERAHEIGAPPPARLSQVAPGEVDVGWLEEADCTLTATYDPDGSLEHASLIFEGFGGWRTELLAPGYGDVDGESYNEAFAWRARQWNWVKASDEHAEDDEDAGDDDAPEGAWMLRGTGRVELPDVLTYLPEDIKDWAIEMTETAVRSPPDFGEDDPGLLRDLEALNEQLTRARATVEADRASWRDADDV
jgi:hypothetical protein